ncbi:MAG: hypothetical protein V4596_11845 [Bdellovibrionota bacterium]
MYSNEDILGIVSFIKTTPEGNLIKMLKDKEMTETHIRLLIKLAKNSKDDAFLKSFNDELVPNMKMNNNEHEIKEKFWSVAKRKLTTMGLLTFVKAA